MASFPQPQQRVREGSQKRRNTSLLHPAVASHLLHLKEGEIDYVSTSSLQCQEQDQERRKSSIRRSFNVNEHLMTSEWIAPRADFLPYLEEGEIDDGSRLEQWKKQIEEQERALNELASSAEKPSCSRGNEPGTWTYKGTLDVCEQDLRGEIPLPEHRYRKFKGDDQLRIPENLSETHARAHPGIFIVRDKDSHYVANVPSFVQGLHQNPYVNPGGPNVFPTINQFERLQSLFPLAPVEYPDYTQPPPLWRTVPKTQITMYLPPLQGQELCDAWTRLNMPRRDVQWSPKWRDSKNDYFPVIVHQKNHDCWLAAHNHMAGHDPERTFAWMIMALLPFLPDDVHKLIAGEGGLLCFDGGEYLALPRQEFWKQDWPSQSITIVCNPLLRTVQLLPPVELAELAYEFKRAKLVIVKPTKITHGYYILFLVGQRSEPYCGSQVVIYDSRQNAYTKVSQYEIPPSPRGTSSVVMVHRHLYWGGLKDLGPQERNTECRSKKYQPGVGPNGFESVIVGYDIDGHHFRHLHFERNMEYGDLGCAEGFEPPRLLGCNNIVYMVTRQTRSKRNFQRIQRSDTVKLVYPPRVFRIQLMSDPVKCEPMSQVPHKIHQHLFGDNQTNYNECQFEARAGLGKICFYALRKHTFAIFNAELNGWKALELLPRPLFTGQKALIDLGDCVFSPSFNSVATAHLGQDPLHWYGQEESFPTQDPLPVEELSENERYASVCCEKPPVPYQEGKGILGPGPYRIEGNLPVARRLSSMRRSATFMEPPSPYAIRTRRTSAQMPSYIAPKATPTWSQTPLDYEEDDQPPHPPTCPVEDFDMI